MSNIINREIHYPYTEYGCYEEKFNLKEKHDCMLELLSIFDRFCREKGIHYSLADGTLLGAMRHGDFIPWDDDADVMMTREEYNKLRKILNENCPFKVFKIQFLDRFSTPEYLHKGYYIDLFINEDMPSSKLLFFYKKNATRFLRTFFNNRGTKVRNVRHDHYNSWKRVLYRTAHIVSRSIAKVLVGRRDVFDLNDDIVSIHNAKSSGIYTRYTSRMYETNRRFNKSKYNEGYSNVQFRGIELMSITNAKVFLEEMYGDYSNLPPEEKRKPEHPINMLEAAPSSIKWLN